VTPIACASFFCEPNVADAFSSAVSADMVCTIE
jgi:hypothetical protein